MQDDIHIHLAQTPDAAALAALIDALWPGEGSAAQAASALGDPTRHTQLASAAGRPVGFCDSFTTVDREGALRWEIDLLGVLPTHHGQGLGTYLIRDALAALFPGASRARALIADENTASQAAFARCGFYRDLLPVLLYIADADPNAPQNAAAHCIPVTTLTYSGLWVENARTAADFHAARGMAHAQGVNRVGSVIPQPDSDQRQAAESAGYTSVGRYGWWLARRP